MYKLVAIDLDGTMLNSKSQITERTKNALKAALEKSVEVIIASGRNINSIKSVINDIKVSKYCVSGNGAAIYDLTTNELLYEKYMKKEEILKAIKICEKNDIYYTLYTNELLLTKNLNYTTLAYYCKNLKLPYDKRVKIALIDDLYEYVVESDEEFVKIMICEENEEKFLQATKELKKIEGITLLDMCHTYKNIVLQDGAERRLEYYYAEVLDHESDKWNAIEYLINELNIKKEEVIAIGDNANDFKMLENAGLGISLKGSNPKAIEKADVIVSDHNSDGVAEAIEKYVI